MVGHHAHTQASPTLWDAVSSALSKLSAVNIASLFNSAPRHHLKCSALNHAKIWIEGHEGWNPPLDRATGSPLTSAPHGRSSAPRE
jgi:hypothetical protein